MRDVSFDESMAGMYAKDPAFAEERIHSLLQDGEASEMVSFLRQRTKAFGWTQDMTELTGLVATDLAWPIPVERIASLDKLRKLLRAMKLHPAARQVPAA